MSLTQHQVGPKLEVFSTRPEYLRQIRQLIAFTSRLMPLRAFTPEDDFNTIQKLCRWRKALTYLYPELKTLSRDLDEYQERIGSRLLDIFDETVRTGADGMRIALISDLLLKEGGLLTAVDSDMMEHFTQTLQHHKDIVVGRATRELKRISNLHVALLSAIITGSLTASHFCLPLDIYKVDFYFNGIHGDPSSWPGGCLVEWPCRSPRCYQDHSNQAAEAAGRQTCYCAWIRTCISTQVLEFFPLSEHQLEYQIHHYPSVFIAKHFIFDLKTEQTARSPLIFGPASITELTQTSTSIFLEAFRCSLFFVLRALDIRLATDEAPPHNHVEASRYGDVIRWLMVLPVLETTLLVLRLFWEAHWDSPGTSLENIYEFLPTKLEEIDTRSQNWVAVMLKLHEALKDGIAAEYSDSSHE